MKIEQGIILQTEIVGRIKRGVVFMSDERILVTRASMPPYEEYVEAIRPLWDSHWITNMGRYHRQLEMELKEYLDVPELSLMVNGHMALELAIQAFGFPEGAEVVFCLGSRKQQI